MTAADICLRGCTPTPSVVSKKSAGEAPGLGFGAEPGNGILKQMRDLYHSFSFYSKDGTPSLVPSPVYATELLKACGLKLNGKRQRVQRY